jgi:hypothetical protein
MKIIFGGRLLVPKADVLDMWHALLEEYRRETTKVAAEAFFAPDSQDETTMAVILQKRVEGLTKLAEIARIYEPRFVALTKNEPIRRSRPKHRQRKTKSHSAI